MDFKSFSFFCFRFWKERLTFHNSTCGSLKQGHLFTFISRTKRGNERERKTDTKSFYLNVVLRLGYVGMRINTLQFERCRYLRNDREIMSSRLILICIFLNFLSSNTHYVLQVSFNWSWGGNMLIYYVNIIAVSQNFSLEKID